jgi:thiol-disulfide isomerase/thioredoxin
MNDTLTTSVDVVEQVGTRLSMVEDFTSSTCPPCEWLSNSGFDGAGLNAGLSALNANAQSGAQVSVVKYPVDWPGNGDHAWNSEVEARRAYYGVTGAPTPFVDGTDYNFSSFNSGDVSSHQDDIAFHDISATHSVSGTDITVNVTVDPYATETATLHIALVEKGYDAGSGASFSNGETEFHHIMRKMLPNANGTSVSLTAGTQYTTSESYSATVQAMNDFDLSQSAGTFAFHSGAEIEVVAWLQAADQSIMNSTVSVGDTEWITSVEEFEDNTKIGVYPNPVVDGQLNLIISTENSANALVTVTDMTGAVVLTENIGKIIVGTTRTNMNIESLATGLYNVNVLTNGHVSSTKVMVK